MREWAGSDGFRGRVLPAVLAAAAALVLMSAAPRLRPPRAPEQISSILGTGPHVGDCDRCHSMHGEGQPAPLGNLLMAPDDNALCLTCHATPWAGGSLAGQALFSGTGHGSKSSMIWPGPIPPQRIEPDAAGKCLNCHDPHGWSDVSGTIPFLMLQREEKLCLTCHDGSPALTNIQLEVQKTYRHPVTDYTGRHTGPLESLPSDFGTTPVNRRHAECPDCHDPHVSRADFFPPSGSDASKRILGASRVTVLNGAAGSAPSYTFVPGSDTLSAPTAEYSLCFKCHSSWTTQPAGQTDMARVLNPANPSFHPIEGLGRNTNINMLAFVTGWSALSTTRCTDCHGSDFGTTRGPHGSANRYILKAPYTASSASRTMASNEICFVCHRYDVYANSASSSTTKGYSRFNPPGFSRGHASHVGSERYPCYACHTTHGSTTRKHLIITGRTPGMQAYTETTTGGTCTPTCHGSETYTINYAR